MSSNIHAQIKEILSLGSGPLSRDLGHFPLRIYVIFKVITPRKSPAVPDQALGVTGVTSSLLC